MMGKHPFKPEKDGREPTDIMIGICGTCKTQIRCRRQETLIGGEGVWGETPHKECPQCKARIYMMTAPKTEPLVFTSH